MSADTCGLPQYSFLGVRVNALTYEELLATISSSIDSGRQMIIGNHNLHSVYLHARDATMREFCQKSGCIYIDGMPLVLLGRLLGHPLTRKHRVTFIDWQPLFAEAQLKKWRVFYVGSKPGVADKGADVLRKTFLDLNIECWHGYFDMTSGCAANEEVVARINDFRPQLLLVGMGMPLQEAWILRNWEHLNANVVCNCGATMDYIAGAVPTPPRWMGRLGLDWLYRLASEPRRLAGRYLVEPWFISWLLAKEIVRRLTSRPR